MKKCLLVIIIFCLTLYVNAQTISDVDGNTYNTVTIGTQVWMKENLKTTKYTNNTTIPNVVSTSGWPALTTPAYCNYNNTLNADTINTYGRLYNWYAVNTGKLCPTGWSVPTDAQWTTLENYLIANGYNYDGSTVGNKFAKALASDWGWTSSVTEGAVGNTDYPTKRNATGFTALPLGIRNQFGAFSEIGTECHFWTSSIYTAMPNFVIYRHIVYNLSDLINNPRTKVDGFSVRCIRDISANSVTISDNPNDKIIYPNPANDILYIKNSKLINAYVLIFDVKGNEIMNIPNVSGSINISNLEKGIYLVKIIDKSSIVIRKLIKE